MTNRVPLEYVTSFADSNQAIMQQLTSALLTSGDSGAEFSRFAEVASVQQNYLAEMSALWVNALVAPAATPQKTDKSDRRFAGDQWKQSPYHNFLKDMYLVNTRYVNNLIERAIVDEKTRGRLRFFARQILDAMSPANYLATNPQALQRAMETGGNSVALGIRNLLQDISKGRITMSDEQAFRGWTQPRRDTRGGGFRKRTYSAHSVSASDRAGRRASGAHRATCDQQVLCIRLGAS
jgi:poly[(R)-3-hydroxyalkanoate] polymerase subunit PhaC